MLVDALCADVLHAHKEQDNHLSLVFPRGKGKRHVVYVNIGVVRQVNAPLGRCAPGLKAL